jgi:hypothetical protein
MPVTSQFSMMSTPTELAHRTGPALPGAGQHRQTLARIAPQQGQQAVDRIGIEQLVVGSDQTHRMHAPAGIAQLGPGLDDLDLPPLADHQVEIQTLAQVFPQAQVLVLKPDARFAQVVRANHRRVAAGIAAAEPAALEHRHPGQALIAHQMPGGRQAMATTADHHRVVAGGRLGRAPGPGPAPVTLEALSQ